MTDTKRLGRGISTLIPSSPKKNQTTAPQNPTSDPTEVALAKLRVNPRQPRKHFDADALHELTQSIVQKGILQPLLVRPVGHHFEIIAGERRFRAAIQAGLAQVPVHVVSMDDQEQLEAALIENIVRKDLSAIETAKAFSKLSKEFGLTQAQIATRTGKDRSTVANLMRLLQLPKEIQTMVSNDQISMGHARALLAYDNASHQIEMAKRIVSQGLSVRDVENARPANPATKTTSKQPKSPTLSPNLRNTLEDIQRKLGTKVTLTGTDKGKLTLSFFHPEELNKILTQLLR